MTQIIKINNIEKLTHNVKKFTCEKPKNYSFNSGQATEVAVNKPGWETEKRPFTFTSLNQSPELEFTIKIYKDHPGVTNMLDTLNAGDELMVADVWGAITYKGPGYFIAGGAGITPFISILRQLHSDGQLSGNKLFFSNKTEQDIILRSELTAMLGADVIYAITAAHTSHYYNGYIDEAFLRTHVEDFGKSFYLCGPPPMVDSLQEILSRLGAAADAVVFEK